MIVRIAALTVLVGFVSVGCGLISAPEQAALTPPYTFVAHRGEIFDLAVSPDSTVFATASQDSTVKIWRVASGRLIHTLSGAHSWNRDVAFGPKGLMIAIAGGAHPSVWDVETGMALAEAEINSSTFAIAFHPEGNIVALSVEGHPGSMRGVVALWNWLSGEVQRFPAHRLPINRLAFSPSGEFMVTASQDGTVKIWSFPEMELLHTLRHEDMVFALDISPDSKFVASGSRDGTVKLWRAESGTLIRQQESYNGGIYALAFNQEGTLLASGAGSGSIRVWEVASGNSVAKSKPHAGKVYGVSFARSISVSAYLVASASFDGRVSVSPLETLDRPEQ